MKNVLIAGGTGLVGIYLTKMLSDRGYNVSILSRQKFLKTLYPTYYYNYKNGKIDKKAVLSADVIINLAGANIAEKKWTKKRKQEILNSRVETTKLIFNTIKNEKHNLKTYISASAVGYYGAVTSNKIFNENDKYCDDFLGNVCNGWEKAADLFQALTIRTVKIRTGIVLSEEKGALEKIKTSFKFFTKVVLGTGKQIFPWIHIHDLCNIYIKAIEDKSMQGAYNAVAPEAVNYSEFANTLKSNYKNIFFNIKIPTFILKFMLGEMSVILLEGSKISAEKIINTNFKFKFYNLNVALKDLIK